MSNIQVNQLGNKSENRGKEKRKRKVTVIKPPEPHNLETHHHRHPDDAAEDGRSHKAPSTTSHASSAARYRKSSASSNQTSDITRRSTGRPIRRSMIHSHYDRAAITSDWHHHFRKGPRVPNTYKMSPDLAFCESLSRQTMESELDQYLSGITYHDPEQVGIKAKIIGDHIKQMVKLQGFRRYKIVCTVTLGESRGQGFIESSRCLWDVTNDKYVTVSRDNGHVFAVVTVFALYHE